MKQRNVRRIFLKGAGLLGLAVWWLAGFAGCARDQTQFVTGTVSETAESAAVSETDTLPEADKNRQIYVHVCGAVHDAGVYTFTENARVFEAIAAAGGFVEDAAQESVNQARILVDGEELYIPTREELAASPGSALPGTSDTGSKEQKVNINTADVEELTTLTGIGETRARAIIAWREENGGFSSVEDIKNIDGIAEKTYEKLKDRITVN